MVKKKKFVKSLLDTEVLSLFNIESLLRCLQINASGQVKILMLQDMYIEKLFRKKYIRSCTYGDISQMELAMKVSYDKFYEKNHFTINDDVDEESFVIGIRFTFDDAHLYYIIKKSKNSDEDWIIDRYIFNNLGINIFSKFGYFMYDPKSFNYPISDYEIRKLDSIDCDEYERIARAKIKISKDYENKNFLVRTLSDGKMKVLSLLSV